MTKSYKLTILAPDDHTYEVQSKSEGSLRQFLAEWFIGRWNRVSPDEPPNEATLKELHSAAQEAKFDKENWIELDEPLNKLTKYIITEEDND